MPLATPIVEGGGGRPVGGCEGGREAEYGFDGDAADAGSGSGCQGLEEAMQAREIPEAKGQRLVEMRDGLVVAGAADEVERWRKVDGDFE